MPTEAAQRRILPEREGTWLAPPIHLGGPGGKPQLQERGNSLKLPLDSGPPRLNNVGNGVAVNIPHQRTGMRAFSLVQNSELEKAGDAGIGSAIALPGLAACVDSWC